MDVSKIVRLVAVLVAVVAGLIDFPQEAGIIAVLGIVGGYFIEEDRHTYILVATIALNLASEGLGAIWGVGGYLNGIFGSLTALFNAGALTIIVLNIINRLKP